MSEQDSDYIGVLWKNKYTSKSGEEFFQYNGNVKCPHCGDITFIKEYDWLEKKSEKHPDRSIKIDRYKENQNQNKNINEQSVEVESESVKDVENTFDDDDIPF